MRLISALSSFSRTYGAFHCLPADGSKCAYFNKSESHRGEFIGKFSIFIKTCGKPYRILKERPNTFLVSLGFSYVYKRLKVLAISGSLNVCLILLNTKWCASSASRLKSRGCKINLYIVQR
jgi:hypothetical protein